jgi:hypothetical protein
MRWPNPPLALALDGASCHVDQAEVLILRMASNYWVGVA